MTAVSRPRTHIRTHSAMVQSAWLTASSNDFNCFRSYHPCGVWPITRTHLMHVARVYGCLEAINNNHEGVRHTHGTKAIRNLEHFSTHTHTLHVCFPLVYYITMCLLLFCFLFHARTRVLAGVIPWTNHLKNTFCPLQLDSLSINFYTVQQHKLC